MSAEDTLQQGRPQNAGDFLFRVALVSALLSIAVVLAPPLLVALPYVRIPPLGDVFIGLLFFVVGAAWLGAIAVMVATTVVIVVGIPLWQIFHRDETWTRHRAALLGAAGGAIISAVEVAYLVVKLWSGPSYIPDGFSPAGLAFGSDGAPGVFTWLKLALDVVLTIGIGALSARWAWRPPTPPSGMTDSPQSSPSPQQQ